MKGKRGEVEVFLPRESFNAVVQMLSEYVSADTETLYGQSAKRIRRKILQHSRPFVHDGQNKAVTYFYVEEAAMLLKLFAFYFTAVEQNGTDYYTYIGKEI